MFQSGVNKHFSETNIFLTAITRVGGNMKKQPITAVVLSTALTAGAIFASATSYAEPALDNLVAVSQQKVAQGKKSQVRINKLQDETMDLIDKYKSEIKNIEGLKVYIAQQEKRLDSQRKIMDELRGSIGNVTVIQRQIGPLVSEMLEGIEQFVELDAPFNKEKRMEPINNLKLLMPQANVSIAEKFRQVLAIYKNESEASRKIFSYPTDLDVGGETIHVDVLAIGRIALMYQTKDGTRTGVWDRKNGQWVELDSNDIV